jgi:hypothetical protein
MENIGAIGTIRAGIVKGFIRPKRGDGKVWTKAYFC